MAGAKVPVTRHGQPGAPGRSPPRGLPHLLVPQHLLFPGRLLLTPEVPCNHCGWQVWIDLSFSEATQGRATNTSSDREALLGNSV